ncbi:MAG: GAF domain-containing protein [Myxococcota bacterium]|nr:GAF domain-containing protein [Myxococcota bacterium]
MSTAQPATPEDSYVANLEHQLERMRRRMEAIQEIGTALGSTLNLDRLLRLIMSKITDLMAAERSTLYLLDEDRRELWAKVAQGAEDREIRIPVGEGLAGWVAKTGQSINIKDAYQDPRFSNTVDEQTGFRTYSITCQPIRNHRRKIIGVVQVLNKRDGYFTVEDEQLLAALAAQAAVSIENSKLYLKVVGKNIELLDTQEQLKDRISEMDLLFRLEQQMNQTIGLDTFLSSVLDETTSAIPAAGGAILTRHESGWRLLAKSPDYAPVFRSLPLEHQGVTRRIADYDSVFLCNALCEEELADEALSDALGVTLNNAIGLPLQIDGRRLGALILVNRRDNRSSGFTDEDLKLLTVIGGRAEVAIMLANQRQEVTKRTRLAAIGQALSGVLHDLKTPMTIVGGYAQLMVDEEDSQTREEYSKSITNQLSALKGMTGEILSFARGESTLLIRKVFIHQLMKEVQEALTQEFKGRTTLTLELNYRDAIRLDSGKIKRVMFNLARNAHQAMPEGGEFLIRTAESDDGQFVDFWFSDDGPGIPESIRHNLFESFVTSGKESGTGLGLAIVKKIVEQHNGSVDFTTRTEDGTTIHIRLPKAMRT